MPRTTLALTSFIAGEFSAKLDGRTDFEKYLCTFQLYVRGGLFIWPIFET